MDSVPVPPEPPMLVLVLDALRWECGGGRSRLDPDRLLVRSGEIAVVADRSAEEADTFAEVLLGRKPLDGGQIRLADAVIPLDMRREIALVPAGGGLFPHLSVRENIVCGRRGVSADAVRDAAARFGVKGHLDRRPGDLAHEERIRVALARATCASAIRALVVEDRAGSAPCHRAVKTARKELPDLPLVVVTDDATQVVTLRPDPWEIVDAP
ncbi:ATP-binding cassette domain-containing protein [Sphaerisporangium sp. B11E5]|uniref:ATP-binding cassette domain-containing protein n=1 Tax=Sphaerisporangium sp. B11E5 TaxID=3153563 RepID=UPI00325CD693